MRSEAKAAIALAATLMLTGLSGCGGGNSSPPPAPPAPPDLSGVWAGVWQGNDPSVGGLGMVSGTWDVEITQGASSASGPVVLLGDVDCMDGQMQTNPGGTTAITGFLARTPCATVNWTLTALNVDAGSASGSWTNFGTNGKGTLSGTRIARLNGPRIEFISPPGAKPGAVVTLSGQSLSGLSPGNSLLFSGVPQPTQISADATRIVARVPTGATSGAVQVITSSGVAASPRSFSTDVISPPLTLGNPTPIPGVAPAALAVSPDGRKFYVADRGNNTVRVVRASTLQDLISAPVYGGIPRSVVASPNGKRIYVAAAGLGVLIMDAATATLLDTISLPSINDGGRDNPQGLAISPDGTMLLVSDGANGGGVSLLRIADKFRLNSFAFAASIAPLGVAFSPDGSRIYIAAADLVGASSTLNVFDAATGATINSTSVGVLPTGIAVGPDGNLVYVSNQGSNSVSVYNTLSHTVVQTVPVGSAPTGIAIAPDGTRIYVANRGSNTVSVFDATTGTAAPGSPLTVGTAPIAVAINPRGTTAYVSNVRTNPVVQEIGGMRTLTIALDGSGIGRVQSTVPGIDCGTQCQAQFFVGTTVMLSAMPDTNSNFSGWYGDIGCGGIVMLNTNLNCRATFTSKSPPPSSGGSSGGCYYGCSSCFIATAAYGSAMAEEVVTLRRFRDDYLLKNGLGRAFVRVYYRYSPDIADYIRERDSLRAAVRLGLWPLVVSVKHPAGSLFTVFCLALLMFRIRRVNRNPGDSGRTHGRHAAKDKDLKLGHAVERHQ